MLSDEITKIFGLEKKALSIQQIANCLDVNGRKVHRLYLSGYLARMEETGELIEFPIGSAKMYLPAKDMVEFYESLLDKRSKMV